MTELEKHLLEALERLEKQQQERDERLTEQLGSLTKAYREAIRSFEILAKRYEELNRSINRL